MAAQHASFSTPFGQRADTAAHPLTAYLYRLMVAKASNLCLSADVSTARELLLLADRVGPSIVVLKTHYDIVSGWDYNPQTGTGAQLAALGRKHGFLLFEDRKFADIGKTAQQQYTAGTARIIEWAHLVTVNMDAGAAAVTALADAAAHWRERIHYEVKTSVTVGTPVLESYEDAGNSGNGSGSGDITGFHGDSDSLSQLDGEHTFPPLPEHGRAMDGRKSSIVSITTAVTQHFEPVESPRLPRENNNSSSNSLSGGCGRGGRGSTSSASGCGCNMNNISIPEDGPAESSMEVAHNDSSVYDGLEEAPLERGILLLAQMSSKGNLMTPAYTQACVEAARAHTGFVAGFIAQQNLNVLPDDTFIHLTPGCKLPSPEEERAADNTASTLAGDGLGQQYNTPAKLVGVCGSDIVIVGRGIVNAADPPSEAERYRRRAWKAYLARLKED
ncbi:orotidine-5 -phosphate decarboxylase [Grosmannia clavigera kw1407]|uniref:Orotidine 5'-phosphate decarboxylase n=1 Tax=Grosmannia clavigera (strain kw1407 / UAMH 11150) TaxID=655863 RepID=F0XD61_GROCL|nr:orotidine-5 -phosphate decarboxylase [Grosmannia clavigera kw1407]EFX03802.1 orotidine-5 -phosphate decarboxylase [Grosmannia clavigera kw1407]